MILIEDRHSIDEYISLLSESNKIYISVERLRDAIKESRYRYQDFMSLVKLQLSIDSCGEYTNPTSDKLIDFLIRDGVSEKVFVVKDRKSLSFDKTKVVQPLIDRGVHTELLGYWIKASTYSSYQSILSKLYDRRPPIEVRSNGEYVFAYNTTVKQKENLRAYYSDIGVLSIPKVYSNIICSPGDDYILGWCDFPQADWRFAYNLLIKDESNFEVMSKYDDAYEGLARLVEKDRFNPTEFKTRRKEYKVDCLKVLYNSKSQYLVASLMREFYRSCPKYMEILKKLYILYKFRVPIQVTSYFGFEQIIPEGRYPDEFIAKAISTMIQTITSHVVKETVFSILEQFWSLGYTKEDINVYFVRHDEPVFYMKRKVLNDAWIFGNSSDIQLSGFSPIKLEFDFGYSYKDSDDELNSIVQKCIDSNQDKMDFFEVGELHEYEPLPTVKSIFVECAGHDTSNGDMIVKITDNQTFEEYRYSVNCESFVDVFEPIVARWSEEHGNPQYLYVTTPELKPRHTSLNGVTLMAGSTEFKAGI